MMSHLFTVLFTGMSLLAMADSTLAEVLTTADNGFSTKSVVKVSLGPVDTYNKLIDVAGWWDPAHTYSGDATNLKLEARPGGQFAEQLPQGGGVQHLQVVYAAPGKMLRLSGGLGPLQSTGATGSLTFSLAAKDGGTEITLSYVVGGYVPGGAGSWAKPVDGVLTGQLERLKTFADTGKVPGRPSPKR